LRPKHGLALEIGTVDGMQGREKEAVIISLVRSNNTVCPVFTPSFISGSDLLQRDVGFLKEKRRMNGMYICEIQAILCLLFLFFSTVAMTRAKRHLVSFGPTFAGCF
jgi:DNA polymerase alpha-associated DNA helicase A